MLGLSVFANCWTQQSIPIRRVKMTTSSIQSKFYLFVLLYQKLIGLAPYSYNKCKKKFFTNKWHLFYPLVIMLSYTYGYYVLVLQQKGDTESTLNTWLLNGMYITVVLPWFVQCNRRNSMVKFFNAAFRLNQYMNNCADEKEFRVEPILLRVGVVAIVNSGLHCFAVSGMTLFYKNASHNNQDKVATYAFNLFTFAIRSAIPLTFYGMTWIAKLYFKKLNYATSKVMRKAESKIQHRRGKETKLNGFDDLSAWLDRICILHSELTSLTQLFNQIYAFQMVTTFVDYFTKILSNVFFIYQLLTDANKDPSEIFLFAFISTFTCLFDVWCIGHTCDDLMNEAQNTGVILHRVYLPDGTDLCFQKSVELFSIHLIQRKLEINACHMFTIDSTLLAAILITTTTHLIIIIQFDMAAKEMNLPK